jgi:hypothetical protein
MPSKIHEEDDTMWLSGLHGSSRRFPRLPTANIRALSLIPRSLLGDEPYFPPSVRLQALGLQVGMHIRLARSVHWHAAPRNFNKLEGQYADPFRFL